MNRYDKVHEIKAHPEGWAGVGQMSEMLCLKDELLLEEIVRGGRTAMEAARVKPPDKDRGISGMTSAVAFVSAGSKMNELVYLKLWIQRPII